MLTLNLMVDLKKILPVGGTEVYFLKTNLILMRNSVFDSVYGH